MAALLVAGSLLFSMFEGLPLFDSLYWTITVLTTVGFGDIVPRTAQGKLLYMGLVASGIAVYGYVVSNLFAALSEVRLKNVLASYLPGVESAMKLRGHVVILGWNRFAESAYQELEANGLTPVVVVEQEELARVLAREKLRVVHGELGSETTLREAGVEGCRAVLIFGNNMEKNLVSILRVRRLSEKAPIVVLSEKRELDDVYHQAGATHIVNAYDLTGRLAASWVFEPLAGDVLLDLAEARRDLDLVQVRSEVEETVGELERRGFASKIIVVQRGEKRFYTPGADFQLRRGDVLVLVGHREHLKNDVELVSGGS